jgi:hypothetical protein
MLELAYESCLHPLAKDWTGVWTGKVTLVKRMSPEEVDRYLKEKRQKRTYGSRPVKTFWIGLTRGGAKRVVYAGGLQRRLAEKGFIDPIFEKQSKRKYNNPRERQRTNKYRLMIIYNCTPGKEHKFGLYGQAWWKNGIDVCKEWRESGDNFLRDMGPCPPGHRILRLDESADFFPGNCYWGKYRVKNRIGEVHKWIKVLGIANTIAPLEWKCECVCGNITTVKESELKTGSRKSCGCKARGRHAKKKER